MSDQYTPNPAVRMFATEIHESDYHFKENDEEKAPEFLLLPTGGKASRVSMAGTLSAIEDVSGPDSDHPFWKATLHDRTEEFSVVAGQYNEEASRAMQEAANRDDVPPAYAIVTGKTSEYRPDDDEGTVIVNVQAERFSLVDREEYETWVMNAVENTLSRIENDEGEYVSKAANRYGNPEELFKTDLLDAFEVVEDV